MTGFDILYFPMYGIILLFLQVEVLRLPTIQFTTSRKYTKSSKVESKIIYSGCVARYMYLTYISYQL